MATSDGCAAPCRAARERRWTYADILMRAGHYEDAIAVIAPRAASDKRGVVAMHRTLQRCYAMLGRHDDAAAAGATAEQLARSARARHAAIGAD